MQQNITSMPLPSKYDLEYIRKYVEETLEMGPMALNGPDAEIWGSSHPIKTPPAPDLVALQPRQMEDPFSQWVADRGMELFFRWRCHRWRKPSPDLGLVGYTDVKLLRITYFIISVLAPLLPISSIVILYYVKSMGARLAVIGGFNVAFSLALFVFTNSRRSEVFAAVAA
jgi:hypothetical protein